MWLDNHLDGRVEMSLSDLAQQFGWTLTKLRRSLSAWAKAGRITQASGSKGKVILESMACERTVRMVGRAFGMPSDPPSTHKPVRSVAALIASAVLFVTALGLTAVGLVMNARFAASFGQTAEAAVLLAGVGLAVDLLAVSLPSVGVQLWHRRSLLPACVAWTIWLAVLMMALLAATGFASTNIGDAVANRAKIAGESAALTERLDRLRLDRAGITESRPAAAIEIELQRAQPDAQAVWRITSGCRDVTRTTSAQACATVLALREALATAERRDAIDVELREVQSKLAVLPAIAMADPQATMAAEIIKWVTGGTVSPAASDIARLRALGLALAPSLAGIIAMLALSLAQVRRA